MRAVRCKRANQNRGASERPRDAARGFEAVHRNFARREIPGICRSGIRGESRPVGNSAGRVKRTSQIDSRGMKKVIFVAALMVTAIESIAYPDRGRSMIITTGGIVASEHPLASQAAAQILANGGNAVDAAITANACMGVLSPMQCGMGGDLFAIVYEAKTGKLYGLNASGWSPAALDAKFLRNQGHVKMPTNGVHIITVPGCVSGWDLLQKKFARKKLPELLAPAIAMAENGFPVPEIIGGYWKSTNDVKRLRAEPSSAAVFLPHDRPPEVGEVFKNPDVAWSLRQVAKQGAKAFYDGPISKKLVEYLH